MILISSTSDANDNLFKYINFMLSLTLCSFIGVYALFINILLGQISQSRSVLRETQYIVFVGLRHFDDKVQKSNSGFVRPSIEQFGQCVQCKSTRIAVVASL